ncbi:MAG: HPr family phosphocarrier protein, partial [Candidatus Omnitrophica bacterium]|nr:HPr family phosphocarrier protein [Candidatus Omnitrophota bacterium]
MRVASSIVDTVKRSKSSVTISKGGEIANGGSLKDLVRLAAGDGDSVVIEAIGEDALNVAVTVEELLKDESILTNLGSGNINRMEPEKNTQVETNNAVCSPQDLEKTIKRFLDNTEDNKESDFIGDSMLYMWLYREGGLLKIQACRDSVLGLLKEISILLEQFNSDQLIRLKERLRRLTIAKDVTVDDEEEITKLADYAEVRETAKNLLIRVDSLLEKNTRSFPDTVTEVPPELAWFGAVDMGKTVVRGEDDFEIDRQAAENLGCYQERFEKIIGLVSHFIKGPPLEVNIVIEPVRTGDPSIWYELDSNTVHIQVILLDYSTPSEYVCLAVYHDFVSHAYLKQDETAATRTTLYFLLDLPGFTENISGFLKRDKNFQIRDAVLDNLLSGKILPEFIELARVKDLKAGDNRRGRVDAPYLKYLLMKLGNCPEELEEMAVGMFEEYPELWQYLSRDENGLTVSEKRIRERISRKPVVLDDRQKDRINRILSEVRNFSNRDFSFERLQKKVIELISYRGESAEMVHDAVYNAINGMSEAMSGNRKEDGKVLGLAGQISGLYEIAVKRGTTLEKISLGSLECANKIVYGRDKTAIKEFDAVNSRAVFEFKFHLTLRKLFQQVIGADSARLSHLEVLTEYPEFKQIRNLVYFGEADDGYVTEALNAFIEDRPEIAPRVFVTESGISVKLTLQEVKEFLGSSITLDLAREEEKSCHKKFFAGDFRRRRIYMQKMIDRKLEALAGEKFDVIIAISNAPEWQLRKAWDIVDGFKYAGCYGIPYDLGLEPAAALKDKILGLLDTPKTGRELIRLLGVNSPDETILVYRICKSSAEIRTVFSGEHYVRMEKVRGEVIPELCPSALNSFLDYEIIGKPGDKAVEARLESLGIERLMISCEKGALIRDLAQKMLDSCCPDGRVVLFISGDVPYGMSCGWRRFGADAGAVDLHILAVVDESAFKQSPVPEIGRMLSDMERLLLTKIREKSDYAIIPLAKIYRYQDRINPDDAIAVKVISESNLLCGNTELYAEVKDAVKKGIWHNIPKLFFECAWESRADLMRRVIESPAAEWDLETREEFFDEACKGPSGLISFILAADVAGFAAGIENPDSARIFERYAEGLRYLEEYLASSGKFTGPPAEVPVAYYSKISERIVFNIAGKEALNILGSKGFSYEESRGIWSFIRGHEEYHQKYPYYSEKEVLAAQRRDLEGDEGISGSDGFIFKRWDKDPQCVAKGQFGKLEEVRDYPQSPFFDEANLPADYTGKINACLASAKKKILAEGIFKEDDFDITVSVVYPAYKSATFRRAKGDKYEIFLDRRCFANSDFLYLAVKHELTDIKIQKLVPEIDPALRELFTLVYVNVDGAMKLRNEHPIKAGGLLKYLRKVANTRIGLFARYEKILANPALNDPSYFIRDICRMLADETVYFKNMRRRAEVLLEGQSFRFNILRARLDILNKKLVESGHLTGGIDFEPLSAFLGGMPQALKVFARYAGSVQYLMEDGKVFLKVNFRNERGEMRFAYIYLGRNDNVELTLGRGGRIFSLSYEDWKKENPGIFYYKYDDMEKEKRVAWGNLKRIPLTQMINKISQYNIARGSRDVGKQLRELFEKLFEEMKLDCPLSSKTWLYLERRIGRNKAPGVYYVIRNQFINDYLNKIFPMILLGEVNVSNAPIKDLEIWPVMERGDMNPSLLRWLSTNKVRGAPLCYREADKISISGLLGILSASVPGQLSLFPGEQPFGGSRRERNHYPLPVSADSRKEAEINFGKNRILADINIDNFDIPCSEPVLAGSSQTLQQLLNTLGLLLGRAPPAVRVVELPATSKAELPELSSWNLVISTDLSLTEGNVAACNIDTKTVYLHPYFFELPESKQLEILYHELISHITKGIRNEEEAMRDTEDFFKIKSLAINVPALVSFHSQFQSLVDQNRIGQDTPEGYRISLRELIRVADFLKHHKNLNPNLALAWAIREVYYKRLQTDKDREQVKELIYSLDSLKDIDLEPIFGQPSDEIESLIKQYGYPGAYLIYHIKGNNLPKEVQSAILKIIRLLNSADETSRKAAILCLKALPAELGLEILQMLDIETKEAIEAFGQLAASLKDESSKLAALDKLEGMFGDAEWGGRKFAFQAYGPLAASLNDDASKLTALDKLEGWFGGDKNPDVRSSSAEAFGQLAASLKDEPSKLAALVKLEGIFKDGNWDVRRSAAEAFGQLAASLKDEPSKLAVLDKLEGWFGGGKNPDVRSFTAQAFGQFAASLKDDAPKLAALDKLGGLFRDEHARSSSAEACGQIAVSLNDDVSKLTALTKLEGLFKNGNQWARYFVIKECGQVAASLDDDSSKLTALDKLEGLFRNIAEGIRSSSAEAFGQVVASLEDEEEKTRVLPKLEGLFRDEDRGVRSSSAKAYGTVALSIENNQSKLKALDKLEEMFKDRDSDVRFSVAQAYGQVAVSLKDESSKIAALDKLEGMFEDADVRFSVAEAYGQLAASLKDDSSKLTALDKLEGWFKDETELVRSSSAEAYGQLAASLKDDSSKLTALVKLEGIFKDGNWDVRRPAVKAAVLFAASLKDESSKLTALTKLEGMLGDEYSDVRFSSAAQSYSQIFVSVLAPYKSRLQSLYETNHAKFISTYGTNITQLKV